MDYQKELTKLQNLSFRYAQHHPDEVPNFYDKEINNLHAIARSNGVELSEEGLFIYDDKSHARLTETRKEKLQAKKG